MQSFKPPLSSHESKAPPALLDATLSKGRSWRYPLLFTILSLCALAVMALDVALGSARIPLKTVLETLLGIEVDPAARQIVWELRLPKVIAALFAGAALAQSGLLMQTLFRNPLASPSVLGINGGANLGVALVVLGFGRQQGFFPASYSLFGEFALVLAACLGASLVLLLVLAVAKRVTSGATLLILGLMLGYVLVEIESLLVYFSLPEQVQSYLNWTFGSFRGVSWDQLKIMVPILATSIFIVHLMIKPLNSLLLGENYASSMGLSVSSTRRHLILLTASLAGTVTAFCGPIAFLGVAVPHLCRSLFGTLDHRMLVPATMLMGAILALSADLISQLPGSSSSLPLNTITALIGAPVVIWVILRGRHRKAVL